MKANELRIGNYYNEFENIEKVSWVTLKKLEESLSVIFWCKPIPLNEEWLLKFGLQPNKWFCENSFCIVEDKTGDTHYGWSMKVQNASNTKEIEFGYFKYVHQLQNLYYAITGEELTFKSE
jgi:hypothetical protein